MREASDWELLYIRLRRKSRQMLMLVSFSSRAFALAFTDPSDVLATIYLQ